MGFGSKEIGILLVVQILKDTRTSESFLHTLRFTHAPASMYPHCTHAMVGRYGTIPLVGIVSYRVSTFMVPLEINARHGKDPGSN